MGEEWIPRWFRSGDEQRSVVPLMVGVPLSLTDGYRCPLLPRPLGIGPKVFMIHMIMRVCRTPREGAPPPGSRHRRREPTTDTSGPLRRCSAGASARISWAPPSRRALRKRRAARFTTRQTQPWP